MQGFVFCSRLSLLFMCFYLLGAHFIIFVAWRLELELFNPFALTDFDMFLKWIAVKSSKCPLQCVFREAVCVRRLKSAAGYISLVRGVSVMSLSVAWAPSSSSHQPRIGDKSATTWEPLQPCRDETTNFGWNMILQLLTFFFFFFLWWNKFPVVLK